MASSITKRNSSSNAAAGLEDKAARRLPSEIRNKQVRSETYRKLKTLKKKKAKQARSRRQNEDAKASDLGKAPVKRVPRTIENTREADPTIIQADDPDVAVEEEQDEFAAHFRNERPPNVLLTTSYRSTIASYNFCADLLTVFPCCTFYKRQGVPLKKIVAHATEHGFTDVVVVNEDYGRRLNGLVVCHLPDGPTATFKLSSVVLTKNIKGHGRATAHKPELVLNNFSTRLGMRVGRMFGSLFCQDPTFRGRRVVTFHSQRDFIFFRHHRYIFEETLGARKVEGKSSGAPADDGTEIRAALQELGPRFTLKLATLQRGTFDTKYGEFEWVHKRGEMDTSRRRFHL